MSLRSRGDKSMNSKVERFFACSMVFISFFMYTEYHKTRKKQGIFYDYVKIFLSFLLDTREASIHAGSQGTT